jgi:mannitol-1-/sugar-/sorbitol-6-phosphatase
MPGGRGRGVALLCDLDGTLVDSTRVVEEVFDWWARERGLDPAVVAEVPHGVPSAVIVAGLAPELDPEAEAALIDARGAAHPAGASARPGARELLTGPWPVAVVTSNTLAPARARLAAAGLPEPRVLVTPERVTRGKPDPEPYVLAARELGVDPARCVVVEDAPAGVAAGRAAGAIVVGVLFTHSAAQLADADVLVADLREVPALLEEPG